MILLLRSKLFSYHHLASASPLHATITPSIHRLFSTFPPWFDSPVIDPASKLLFTLHSHYPPKSESIEAPEEISRLNGSPPVPDSTRQFLREYGLNEEQIKSVISGDPRILRTDVDKRMKPRVKELEEMGFSPSDISRVIVLSPNSIRLGSMRQNVKFWLSILSSVENFLKVMRHNMFLLTCNVAVLVEPNISFLKESCGLSSDDIRQILISKPGVIISYPQRLKEAVQKADLLGVPRGTHRFRDALGILLRTTQETFDSKLDILKSLGWSEAEVRSMIARYPYLLSVTEKNIRRTVCFLMKKFGFDLQVIAREPYLIKLSVDKRLFRRFKVIKSLENKGLLRSSLGFKAMSYMSEKLFREKYVIPYKDVIPSLAEEYQALRCKEGDPNLVDLNFKRRN
ncbi:mTERF [Carex littledalei]|uniref:mTERF n=1 Tax=Carex littledalei TaxID=544730 RepID=A0A833QX33_9POAL|nr:mTERF [Carex littledalei]